VAGARHWLPVSVAGATQSVTVSVVDADVGPHWPLPACEAVIVDVPGAWMVTRLPAMVATAASLLV
jgi:hypothetical protein